MRIRLVKLRNIFHLADDDAAARLYRLSYGQKLQIERFPLTADIAVDVGCRSSQKSHIHARRLVKEVFLA